MRRQLLHSDTVDCGAGDRALKPSSAVALFSRTGGGGWGAGMPLWLVFANAQKFLTMGALAGPMRVLAADETSLGFGRPGLALLLVGW